MTEREYNSAEPDDVREARKVSATVKVTNEVIIRTLMNTVDGRRWIWNFLGKCHIFHSTFTVGESGYARTAFQEGQRAIGLEMFADVVRLCPKEYVLMQIESTERKNGGRRPSASDGDDRPREFDFDASTGDNA